MPKRDLSKARLRVAHFQIEGIDLNARTIPISVSSDTGEVLRWVNGFGYGHEVLDHTSLKSIDLSRFEGPNGGPALFNHDLDVIIGRFTPTEVKGGKLYGIMRFGKSVDAERAWQDVQDGILVDTSIWYDYDPADVVQEGPAGKGECPTYRITKWALLEASLVTVPADAGVGVGRSSGRGCGNPSCKNERCDNSACEGECDEEHPCASCAGRSKSHQPPAAPAGNTKEVRMPDNKPEGVNEEEIRSQASKDALTAERERVREINAMCDQFQVTPEKRAEWLGQGACVEDVRKEILEGFRKNASATPAPTSDLLGLSSKDKERYNLGAALRALVTRDFSGAGLEKDVSDALGKKLGRATGGLFVPSDFRMKARAGVPNAMNTGTKGQGQELVFPEYMGFLDLLRNETKVLSMGARVVSGLQGTPTWVKQTGASTFYWLGENPDADVTDSKLTLDVVSSTPKTGKSMLHYTRQQMLMGVESIESLIQADLLEQDAIAVDSASLVGTGSNSQPTGILNTAGILARAMGENGGVPAYKDMTALRTLIKKANAMRLGSGGYLTTPDIEDLLMNTPKMANQIAMPVWSDEGKVGAYRAESTNQMPSNLTKGTSAGNCHAILFGIWSELFILEWGALEITVDPYTKAGQDLVRVITSHLLDVFVRRPVAFAAIKDALMVAPA
jgi:HK97 family phage major capsid protein